MKLAKSVENKIINYFKKKPEIAVVYLYGSQAKATAKPESDIDLAVLVENKKSFEGFDIPQTRYIFDLEKITGKTVEVQDLDSVAVDFAFRVISEGKILIGLNSKKRVAFEEKVLRVYFDMKPAIDEYFYYLRRIARKGDIGVRYI